MIKKLWQKDKAVELAQAVTGVNQYTTHGPDDDVPSMLYPVTKEEPDPDSTFIGEPCCVHTARVSKVTRTDSLQEIDPNFYAYQTKPVASIPNQLSK